jgi:hypothetical protein
VKYAASKRGIDMQPDRKRQLLRASIAALVLASAWHASAGTLRDRIMERRAHQQNDSAEDAGDMQGSAALPANQR